MASSRGPFDFRHKNRRIWKSRSMAHAERHDLEKTKIAGKGVIQSPPDGGYLAWTQVFGAFWIWFNTWGLTNAFGVFQTYYQHKFPNEKPAVISLIGCIQPFVLIFFGFLAGPLWDAGYCQSLMLVGTCITVFGYMMVSICDKYWQVMLAQGVLTGFGSCLLYLPAIAIIPQYFNQKKALANGIAASGSGLGGVIYPIAFRQLLKQLSFDWSVRALAFMILANSGLSMATIRVRLPATTRRKVRFDYKPFLQEPAYGIFNLALLCNMAAQYTPAFFIQDYAQQKGIMNEDLASYLLPMLNACSIFGRIAPNLLADSFGGLNVMIPALLALTVLTFGWIGITSSAGCIVFACLYGFFLGSILSLPPFVISLLCPDPQVVGARMGNSFAVSSFGLLMGPPVAAAILQSGSWLGTQLFAAGLLVVASSGLVFVRLFITGPRLRRKV